MTSNGSAPDYGIDAPHLARFFVVSGLISTGLACVARYWVGGPVVWVLVAIFTLAAVYFLGMGSLMLYWSKVTKLRTREALFDRILWRGDERVLDVGCGRGLMVVGAARRLTSGQAIGIDIWRNEDQSSNTPGGALENARREGVSDRVAIETADMRRLPFDDGAFDIVVSHWSVHNLKSASDRKTALDEMKRVLRPEGTLILADIEHRAEYADQLAQLGFIVETHTMSGMRYALLGVVSFGTFQPFTMIARILKNVT